MQIYLDESGYSGTNLISAESVFVLASCTLSDLESDQLFGEIFGSLPQDAELKHSELRRTNPDMVVEFVKRIAADFSEKFAAYAICKKYALIAKLVDAWVESSFYELDMDFYQNNGHRAFAILLFYSLTTLETPSFCREVLLSAQNMMNRRDPEEARKFFDMLEIARESINPDTWEFFELLITSAKHLGFKHVETMSESALDLCIPALLATTAHWRNQTNEELILLHDKASELEQAKWTWNGMSAVDAPAHTFESEYLKWEFPLKVSETHFVDSKQHRQIQFCDLLAGAMAEALRFEIGDHCDKEYAKDLWQAGVGNLLIGGVWPLLDDAKIKDKTANHQEQISYFVHLLQDIAEKAGNRKGKRKPEFDAVVESDSARRCLREGRNEEAFGHVKKLSDAGFPFFQVLLAEMYEAGCGTAQSESKSMGLYHAAAKKGFAPAQRTLALAYLRGEKIKQDLSKAAMLMLNAAEQGEPRAQHDLGTFYFLGKGVEKSLEKSCDWHEKAADQGFPDSQRELASAYMQGEGRPKDRKKAYALYERAALGGDMMAQFFFGQMHQHGDQCCKDMSKAFEWWKQAAAQGHEVSQFNIALMLLNADGTERDIEQGVYWLKESAATGYVPAVKALPQVMQKLSEFIQS
ncbi:MAG: sel1 repeat family protein [Candidatus Melainabacteria bacterium]|nr:sel1 repeat family protein [Candidatus Melainabacteria bacterium]